MKAFDGASGTEHGIVDRLTGGVLYARARQELADRGTMRVAALSTAEYAQAILLVSPALGLVGYYLGWPLGFAAVGFREQFPPWAAFVMLTIGTGQLVMMVGVYFLGWVPRNDLRVAVLMLSFAFHIMILIVWFQVGSFAGVAVRLTLAIPCNLLAIRTVTTHAGLIDRSDELP